MKNIKRSAAMVTALSLMLSLYGCDGDKKAVRNKNAKMPVSTETQIQKEEKPDISVPDDVKYDMSYEVPVFSCESGFYDSEFEVELSINSSDLKIYYTVDGSTPTADSMLYEGKITVKDRKDSERVLSSVEGIAPEEYIPNKKFPMGTVIRAAAIDKDGISGPVAVNTYFAGIDREAEFGSAPIVSLVTDSGNLFDYESGIYVLGKTYDDWVAQGNSAEYESWKCEGNFSQRGREWERPVNFELIESDGTVGFEQLLGMRIMGKATRTYTQKSFRFHAREEYGEKKISYPLIPDAVKENDHSEKLEKYKSFLLRSGGNDCHYTKIRDPFIQKLVGERSISTQASRPAVVFINGEYWGLYAIQEDYSDNYIQYNYDVDKNDAVIIKCGELEEGQEGDEALYEELTALWKKDLYDPENYENLCSVLDVQSAADYLCTVVLTGNEDCMINLDNNWRIWRSRSVTSEPYQDGKWRFMLYDTEYSLGLYNEGRNAKYNSVRDLINSEVFGSIIRSREFKKLFVLTYMDMVNFIFNPDNAFPVLDELSDEYGPLFSDSVKRFGPEWAVYSGHFERGVLQIKDYMRERKEYAPEMLKGYLGLSGDPYMLTVNCSSGGKVRINTVTPDYSSGSAEGLYFPDYPVTLTAVCDDGYEFSGWSGMYSGSEETITVTLSEASSVNATFSAK